MCIAIPAKLIEKKGTLGVAEIGGLKHEVDLRLLEDIQVGDYVIIHAGFGIQKLDTKEAEETLSLLKEMVKCEM